MGKSVKIPGRLESAETDNIVAGADAIKDDVRGKTQYVVNNELEAAILQLGESKQNKLTFDQTPTEDSPNPVTSGGVYAADQVLSQAIEAILLLIPSAASALNKLVDMATMNSSIATATASFKGTYNLVSDLHLSVDATHAQIAAALDALSLDADNNDYAFVQVPNTDTAPTEIKKTERYKFNGTNWAYEYDLNNSGFTSAQWNAINSGITALLVSKLSALPTNEALVAALEGKQDNLTFDNVPTAGSPNPVKSGGIYTRNNEIVALIIALDAAKQDVLTFDTTPTSGSPNPVTSNGIYLAIQLVQTAVVALDGRMSTAETKISTAETNIVNLQAAYSALTQSDIVVVEGALPSSSQQQNVIYRQPDPDHTPPQFYSDYMWNGTAWVLMATYNNAIDDVPTAGSSNLVKSGGVNKAILEGALILTAQLFDNNGDKVELPKEPISGIYQWLSGGNTGVSRNTTSNYAITQFVELKGATKIHFKGHHTNLAMYVAPVLFYDADYNFISGITVGDLSSSEYDEFEATVPSGAVYARFCSRTDTSEFRVDAISFINYQTPSVILPTNAIDERINNIIKTEEMVICQTVVDKNGKIGNINEPTMQQQTFTDGYYINGSNGSISANNSYIGTDFIYIKKLKVLTWRGYLSANVVAVAAVAFYDENKGFISSVSVGQSGSGATYTTEQSLIENISVPSNAVYCRCCCHYGASKNIWNHPFSLTTLDTENFRAVDILYQNVNITGVVESIIKKDADVDTDMVYIFDKILCIGDSVTEGHVYDYPRTPVNGTVYHQYSYPAMLSQMLNGKTVENAGHSGISASGWWSNYRGDYDYTLYELVIIELGYNGGLSVDDITTQGTNTYDYCQIISYVKQQNPNAYIVLVISSAFNSERANAVIEIASRANVQYIDLRQTTYDNLNADKYHGFDNTEMTERSYWHFNRIGYLAKARVMLKELNAIVHNKTEEINNYIGV